jgi:nitrate/TMAO reductase-like tetraheme cytochrome c subunit
MSHQFRISLQRVLLGLVAAVGVAGVALADGDRRASRVPLLPQYQQECAACHAAYPPGMLPAASWNRVMNNLKNHYGADASLEPATQSELSSWLIANAGTYKRVREEPLQDRITLSAWFIGKHREVAASTWKRPAVKSAANCTACHTQADKGDFNEHNVRIPR